MAMWLILSRFLSQMQVSLRQCLCITKNKQDSDNFITHLFNIHMKPLSAESINGLEFAWSNHSVVCYI